MNSEKAEIVCDCCRMQIPYKELHVEERTLAEDGEGGKITERYFDCPHCGKSYTIACMDKKMEEMIRKRQKLQKKIARGIRSRVPRMVIEMQMREEENLKEELLRREAALREKFLK